MNTNRTTAITVGVLYIIGTVAGILSVVFSEPIRNAPDLLIQIAANEPQLALGALCILIMGLALAMIPIILFPILKKFNETLALGYVVFRGGFEAVAYILMSIGWLLLLPLSRAYVQTGASDSSDLRSWDALLLNASEIGSILTIVFCLGALMFYYTLYQSKLIPRWLSGWGLIGVIPYLASGLFVMFGIIESLSTTHTVLEVPLALQEMVLAVWLIVKGFNPAVSKAAPVDSAHNRIDMTGARPSTV